MTLRRSTALLVAAVSLMLSGRAATGQTDPASIRALLPPGTFAVSRMEFTEPPRLEELNRRFQEAARVNADWFREYAREQGRPGEPLPYHPNLGLTAAEHGEWLALLKQREMRVIGRGEVTVEVDSAGRISLEGTLGAMELSGVVIDLRDQTVETPYGITSTVRVITPNEDQAETGRWSGVAWATPNIDVAFENGTAVRLSLGRLQESGRGFLRYEAREILDGGIAGGADLLLTYALPRN